MKLIKMFRSLLQEVSELIFSQLPLFVMLVVFMIAPTFFSYNNWGLSLFKYVLPQTILPALIFCWIASIKRWCRITIFVVFNLFFLIELLCFFCNHSRLNGPVCLLLLQTNIRESVDFICLSFLSILKAATLWAGIAGAFLLIIHYWDNSSAKIRCGFHLNNTFVETCIGFILVLSFIYSPISIYKCVKNYSESWKRGDGILRNASTPVAYYFAIIDSVFNKKFHHLITLSKTIDATNIDVGAIKPDLTIVYVIGESFSRHHSSIFGYPFLTNPLMEKEISTGSLVVYDDIVSPSQITHIVYPYLLTNADHTNDSLFVRTPLLPSVLRKAGYHVSYYDNQDLLPINRIDYGYSYFLGHPGVREQSVDTYNDRTFLYDCELIDAYPPMQESRLNFIVYHLMGQHFEASKRYPSEFSHFEASDYRKYSYTPFQAQKVAEYDNATLYNDYLLAKVIDMLRDKMAIMIYVPDHGEEVFDFRNVNKRTVTPTLESVRLTCEVPVMIWISDKYKERYAQEVEMLRQNSHKSLYNIDLTHTVMDLAGVYSSDFRPEFSLLREGDGRNDRKINEIEYDKDREAIDATRLRYE